MYVSDLIQIMILGYALGSIPFGILLAKIFGLPDPRYIGSGNIGATNMLRTGNKKVAALTLLLDAGKGAAAVILTHHLFVATEHSIWWQDGIVCVPACLKIGCCTPGLVPSLVPLAFAVLMAAVGHMYSPWLKFKGGKGMATILGGTLAFSWPVGMAAMIVWLIAVFVKRYVSLGSICALAIAPFITWLRVDSTSALIIGIASAIAIWKHRANIKRLRDGFEPRINFSKGASR